MIKSISASHLARAMVCAGSKFFDLPREESSEQAKEGTAAGQYLEHVLKGVDSIPDHASNGVMFDNDMKFYAKGVFDNIRSFTKDEINAELKVDWMTRSGIIIRARYDASFVSGGELFVDDYKYGWGLVEPKENWQLIAYAIGEVIRLNKSFQYINLRVHQPRPHHEEGPVRVWRITYEQLLGYKEMIEARCDLIAQGLNDLETSKECKYCPAAASCPAFNKAWHRGVEVVEGFVQDKLSNEELAFQLDLLYRIDDLCKTRKGSLEELVANRIKQGEVVPGYVVETSYGNRSWKKGIDPKTIEMMTGVNVMEEVVMSPAKVEKCGVPKEVINQLTERRLIGAKPVRKDHSKLADKIFGAPHGIR